MIGTSKTLTQKFEYLGLYATVYKGNPCTLRECPREKPTYACLCMRLYARATRVQVQNFLKRRKIHNVFKHYGNHEPGQDTTHKLKAKTGQG